MRVPKTKAAKRFNVLMKTKCGKNHGIVKRCKICSKSRRKNATNAIAPLLWMPMGSQIIYWRNHAYMLGPVTTE